MPIIVDLTDTEGQQWDIRSGFGNGLRILDGTNDAFDGGMLLRVNGITVDPQAASVDLNGREVNSAPVLIAGVAVSRSILVSDAAISATGFARFLDSFTNTTDAAITITVTTRTNSGADNDLTILNSTDGVPGLTTGDTGFVTTDGALNADSPVMIAYGDGEAGSLAPTSATVLGDDITITHTLTLQPGETQSLLQFVTQTENSNIGPASLDLTAFTQAATDLAAAGFLAGLSREEQLSIVNYSGFDTLNAPHSITDADGNRWGIDNLGRLSTLDSDALQEFVILELAQNFDELVSVTTDAATGEVTVVSTGFEGSPGTTVTYTYTALEGQGAIRLLVTIVGGPGGFAADLSTVAVTGFSPLSVPVFANSPDFGIPSGVVLDDSASGSGGTLPALTFVHGVTGADNLSSFGATTYVNTIPGQGVGPGGTAQYLFFFALNDTGLAALTDITRLNTPGPEELAGLTAAEVASLQNFDLDESDRLQLVQGADGVDDLITGHIWGDSILGGSGDDDISALGSDDIVVGGLGEDQIDGGDGADTLFGGDQDDDIFGGNGADEISGDTGHDYLNGRAGDDLMIGGTGNDRLLGGAGADIQTGGDDQDTLIGNSGNDALNGENGDDSLSGGGDDDQISGGNGIDTLSGGKGNDTLTGGANEDVLNGDEGRDSLSGGTENDEMFGGTENDTLNGEDGNDTLFGGDGTDSLVGGNNDDELFGGTGPDRLFGGNGADSLTGGAAADSGTNRLTGGQDGDTYFVNSANDLVIEVVGGTGTDIIISSITLTLGADVENLTLADVGLLDGFGNAAANRITGNTSANFIDGGLGNDTMTGGLGDDIYIVRDLLDDIQENGGTLEGRDTARSFVTYTLAANVENLILLGTNAINGTGNTAINKLTGNALANQLNGGLGNDTLTGGLGTDAFVFNTALNGVANVDHIADFAGAGERIRLSASVFTALTPGGLSGNFFVNGTAALDANDRILYDAATGTLRYDADGVALASASVVFAVLDNNFALTAGDFLIIT